VAVASKAVAVAMAVIRNTLEIFGFTAKVTATQYGHGIILPGLFE